MDHLDPGRRPGRLGRYSPRCWRLWSLPTGVLAYVAAVEGMAVVVLGATAGSQPITTSSWLWFGLLAGAAVLHLEAAQGIERIRELNAEGSPYTHMQSVWFFAGVLLLPLPMLTALVAVSFTHEWFRVFRGRAFAYRKVFTVGTLVLAVAGAQLVLVAFYPGLGLPYARLLDGPLGAAAVIVAGLVYRLTNYSLVVGAIIATNPDKPARGALGPPSDQLIIAASIGLGYGVAVFTVDRPWSMPILLVTVLALHMGLLLPQFRTASRTDSKTGLCDPGYWYDMAAREVNRARQLSSTVGILLLDLDHFKHVNDTYGHLAGDAVLRAVADTMRQTVRSYDLIGRWGGEEFAVLMPGIGPEEIEAAAERVRAAVGVLVVRTRDNDNAEVTIRNLTVSVGAGVYPDTAATLTNLLLEVDAALYKAKESGRNRTTVAACAITPGQPPRE